MNIMAKVNRTPEIHNRLIDETCVTQIFTDTCERSMISVIASYTNVESDNSEKEQCDNGNKHSEGSSKENGVKRPSLGKNSSGKRPRNDSYYSMSASEREEFDKECERKAEIVSKQQLEAGKPFAPYNTTEFIMGEHDPLEDSHLLDEINEVPNPPESEPSDDYYLPQLNEDEYLHREFSSDYEKTEYDILTNMTNWELVSEYIYLEDEIADIENRLNLEINYSLVKEPRLSETSSSEDDEVNIGGASATKIDESEIPLFEPIDETAEKIRITNEEIRKLTEENEHLYGLIQQTESEHDFDGRIIPTCLCLIDSSDSESGTEDTESDSSSSSSASSTEDSSTDSSTSDSEPDFEMDLQKERNMIAVTGVDCR
ncbi:protein HEXIM1-like isoform X2 [Artemia franciscana]|uniref:protein HEXIM1-like isoform X2 n=1 Tax=Artemia franciscana TaxID=6661 RepID=UPI0032D9F2A2